MPLFKITSLNSNTKILVWKINESFAELRQEVVSMEIISSVKRNEV
jgi:hypothetical protein